MRPLSCAIGLLGVVTGAWGCCAQVIDDPFSEYLQRSVTITLGAGNAKDTNAAIHTINPWPRNVGDTRIPGDGRRAADSIERMYRVPNPFERSGIGAGVSGAATPPTGSEFGAAGSSPVTPVQPISSGY